MGTWGTGILQDDRASDEIADLADDVAGDVARAPSRLEDLASPGMIASGIGILLLLSPGSFDGERGSMLASAAKLVLDSGLPTQARDVLRQIADGAGKALALRTRQRSGETAQILGGPREPLVEASLFEHPASGEYLLSFVERAARRVDEGTSAPNIDFSRMRFVGSIGAIAIVRPRSIDRDRGDRWKGRMRDAYARMEAFEPEFFEEYAANVDAAIDLVTMGETDRAE
jgi:hypothetical protein